MKLHIDNNLKVDILEDGSMLIGLENNILGYKVELTDEEREKLEDFINKGKKINIEDGIIIDIGYMLPQFIQHQIQYH